jgi:hypothetical protein
MSAGSNKQVKYVYKADVKYTQLHIYKQIEKIQFGKNTSHEWGMSWPSMTRHIRACPTFGSDEQSFAHCLKSDVLQSRGAGPSSLCDDSIYPPQCAAKRPCRITSIQTTHKLCYCSIHWHQVFWSIVQLNNLGNVWWLITALTKLQTVLFQAQS